MTERTIFLDALEKTDPVERAAYLQETCGDNALLRQRVEQLLKAFDEAGSFMVAPPGHAITPIGATEAHANGSPPPFSGPRPVVEGPGDRIGPYQLLERIGEGGMGIVFMAEQEAPVRRKVALRSSSREWTLAT